MSIENLCIFIGRLGKAPVVRSTKDGLRVTNFPIAVNEKFGGKEVTNWVNLVCFKGLAEVAEKFLSKGSNVAIQGRLQNRQWQNKNGATQYATEFIVNSLKLMDKAPSSGGQPAPGEYTEADIPAEIGDGDIPF
jgi:single-strand DNA-binding protein